MHRPGASLCVVLLLLWFVVQGRPSSVQRQGPPAFFVEKVDGVRVALWNGSAPPVVRQFNDGTPLSSAIYLTIGEAPTDGEHGSEPSTPLRDGEALELRPSDAQGVEVRRFWMPARWRMALGIPLHPDRMDERDWQALPGIGPKLAAAIELDRQNNGDFAELHRLQRVRGIGPKRLQEWKKYFYDPLTVEKSKVNLDSQGYFRQASRPP
jgi:competence protein ComEA